MIASLISDSRPRYTGVCIIGRLRTVGVFVVALVFGWMEFRCTGTNPPKTTIEDMTSPEDLVGDSVQIEDVSVDVKDVGDGIGVASDGGDGATVVPTDGGADADTEPVVVTDENCCDGIDNNGNGLTDLADPICKTKPLCPINECQDILACAAAFGCDWEATRGEPYLELDCLGKCFENRECSEKCVGIVDGKEYGIWHKLVSCEEGKCRKSGAAGKASCYLGPCFAEFLQCTKVSDDWSGCGYPGGGFQSCGASTSFCWEGCECGQNERCLYNCFAGICKSEVDPFLKWHTCRAQSCPPTNNTVGSLCHLLAGYTTCLNEADTCIQVAKCGKTCKQHTDCVIQCIAGGYCETCLRSCANQRCSANNVAAKTLWQCLLDACHDDLSAPCLESARTNICALEDLVCD
ncbi:MAG: hypothetical protein HUU55_09230 [Myxococcales bacterium]|nr:hypothetical protein [Myxococcales bacterium]